MLSTEPRQVRLVKCAILSPGLETRARNTTDARILSEYGFDLMPYVQKIDIFESIFDNTISGTITLLEDIGLIEYIPIVGVETIVVSFAVDDHEPFTRAFRVTKVSDVQYPRHSFRLYSLQLATRQFVKSMSSRISRAFTNVTCEEAVKDILINDLGLRTHEEQKQIITDEKTYGKVNVVVPFYTPLRAINYFTVLAQTDNATRESNFLFFETLQGFHFTSVRKLIQDGLNTPDNEIRVFNVNPGQLTMAPTVDSEIAQRAALRIHQEQAFDLLHDIASGMLRSKVIHFDFLARRVEPDLDSSYTESFEKTTHLDEYPVYPKNFDKDISQNVRIFTVPSNAWTKDSKYIKQAQDALPEQRMHLAIHMRNRQLRELQHVQTIIDLPGQSDLRAGSVVVVNYPSSPVLEGQDSTINQSIYTEGTPYYSGKHLVTHVHHILASAGGGSMEYRMNIKVCKDSLGAPLIGASD